MARVSSLTPRERPEEELLAIRRQWLSASFLRDAVEREIAALSRRSGVVVRWSGFDRQAGALFGDPAILRRLMVDLALGDPKADALPRKEVHFCLQPSIHIGWKRLVIRRFRRENPASEASKPKDSDWPAEADRTLPLCQSLAAIQLTRLQWSDRGPNHQEQIGFDVASDGPHAVLELFARWREIASPVRGSLTRGEEGSHFGQKGVSAQRAQQRLRFDDATLILRSLGSEQILRFCGPPPRSSRSLVAASLHVETEESRRPLEAIDRLLQQDQGLHELIYPAGTAQWILLWDVNLEQAQQRITNLTEQLALRIPGSSLRWSDVVRLGIGNRGDWGPLKAWFAAIAPQGIPESSNETSDFMDMPLESPCQRAERRLELELLHNTLRRQSRRLREIGERIDPLRRWRT